MTASFHTWGTPPWQIDFRPRKPAGKLPEFADFVVVGGGFAGLSAAAWLKLHAPEKSVALLEAFHIGAGASGRTGGMALAETAAGELAGLGDVLAGLRRIHKRLGVQCDLNLGGAWEIARSGGKKSSPIDWQDSGNLRVTKRIPGGTLDPGKLVGSLARAAQRLGVNIYEGHRVAGVEWGAVPKLKVAQAHGRKVSAAMGSDQNLATLAAGKILFATNALSLPVTGLDKGTHARLTLAVLAKPVSESVLKKIGLSSRTPFYTTDFPYLWARVRRDRSIVWGAGLVQSQDSDNVETVDITTEEPRAIFKRLENRIRQLHPALADVKFAGRWGGPILFRESWKPVLGWHPETTGKTRNVLVLGAFAGHGVALTSYLGAWAAEVLLERRELPEWGRIGHPTKAGD